MIGTGKFKQYLSIPEAALVWSGLPLDLLVEAAYPAPGVPLIVGHPDVTARAEALVEATDRGTLMDCSRIDPDMPLPSADRRKVSRKALMEWITEYWPEDTPQKPARPGTSAQQRESPYPAPPAGVEPPVPDQLLTEREVLARLSISRSALHRLRTAGFFPEPTHARPNRWPLSAVTAYITGDGDGPSVADQIRLAGARALPTKSDTEPDEDI